MTFYAPHPHVFHTASFIRRDADSIHFVIDIENESGMELRLRSGSASRRKNKQNGDAKTKAVNRKRSQSKSEDKNGSATPVVSRVDDRRSPSATGARSSSTSRRCCTRCVLFGITVTSLLVFVTFFIYYVNSEVERTCYDTFPAWLCESTGAEHIKCQLKALFMCKYSVELLENLYINVTTLTSRCENMVEEVCIYFIDS